MRGRYRHPVVRELGYAHRNTYQCRDDNGDEQEALHSSRHQTATEQDADETQDADWRKLAELHESIRIGSNDARILQTDKGDKHTDTCRNGESEVFRNTFQYLVTDIEEGDGKEDDSLYEQYCQSLLPGLSHCLTKGEGEEGVQSHAGSLGKRLFCHESQQEDGNGRSDGCGSKESPLVHACGGKDGRVHCQDVTHGQEGSHTSYQFRLDRSSLRVEAQ